MKKVELLSPVGNMDALIAAIEGGCDAVYMGGKFFSARQYSTNFTNDELKEAITYAHLYGVKVYITVNTIIYESMVESFMMYIDYLVSIGIDALIIQDIGMMDLIRKTYPTLELHASTQMHIHNLEGAKLLEKLGIKRTVLARETDIEEIKNIKENTNIELEVFIHGALCVSYSGQCLMSSLIGGRSGNRGTCSQCCRMAYTLEDGKYKLNQDEYLLSMKDLNTLPYLDELLKSNVDSLKIEGRMKRKEYVYLVTKIYREAIDSYYENGKVLVNSEDLVKLKKMFNREFTKGFLFNEENDNITNEYRPNHMGIKLGEIVSYDQGYVTVSLMEDLNIGDGIRIVNSKEDIGKTITTLFVSRKKVDKAYKGDYVSFKLDEPVKIGDTVLKTTDIALIKELENEINKKSRKVKLNGKVICHNGEPIKLKLICDDNMVECVSDYIIEDALSSPTTKDRIYKQINKLGDTPYEFENLIIDCDDDIFVRIDELNAIRRDAIKKISLIRCKIKNHVKNDYHIEVPNFQKERKVNVSIKSLEDYNTFKNYNVDEWIVDDTNLYEKIDNSIFKLPRVMHKFPYYKERVLVGELGSIYHYDLVDTDFSLNVVNSYSIALLHSLGVNKVTLSYELNKEQIIKMIDAYKNRYKVHPNLELIVYSRPEVMISRFNLLDKYNIDKGILKDKFNNKFPVISKDNLMYIYMYKPIIFEDYKECFELGINHMRVNILDSNDYKEVSKILKKEI